jgi:hypothetical protein
MSKASQEFRAGRIHPAQFDCEPPDNVLEELSKPKRPRILTPPLPVKAPPQPRWPFYCVLAISLLTLAVAIYTSWRQGQTAERAKTTGAISLPTPTPQPTVVPSPTPGPAPRAQVVQRRVPRATLVQHSVPRAQLVALPPAWPPLFVGGRYLATMPYDNLEVLATFRGWLPSQDADRVTVGGQVNRSVRLRSEAKQTA